MGDTDREARVDLTLAGVRITGVSIAGRETWFRLPSLDLAFDLGRSPTELVSVSNVFLSHAHLDHAAGLAYWASQRLLRKLPGGVVRTEPSAVARLAEVVSLQEELEGGLKYDAKIEALAPGQRVFLRKDLAVGAFRADHRIPSLGFLASEVRNRVRKEFHGKTPEEIRAAARAGVSVSEPVPRPLVAYSGDTGKGLFESAPREVFHAKVFLLECSFLEDRDRDRAGAWGHLHLSEITERADLFENEVLVLTHLTLRTSADEIRSEIARRLPARLRTRTIPFLPT